MRVVLVLVVIAVTVLVVPGEAKSTLNLWLGLLHYIITLTMIDTSVLLIRLHCILTIGCHQSIVLYILLSVIINTVYYITR